jgi:uncharacterized cupredoxin-like copper-binding protein
MPAKRTAIVALVATLVLAAVSTVAIAAFSRARRFEQCNPKRITGTGVQVVLTNMGGPMMGGSMMGRVRGGMMRLSVDRSTVAHGDVTFVATNTGSVVHEFVVLPLRPAQIVGTRPVGDDGRISETGSRGEASKTCGAGSGDGIAPGASGWTTLHLAPGRYELVCNLPGHYAAGMDAQLTVT